jgi:SLT domain-containing protein
MGAAANPPTSSAGAQIDWGLGYIKGRYGSPAGAWAHEVANNWYDRGGWLMPGLTLAHNDTGRPEQVIPGDGLAGLAAELRALRGQMAELIRTTAAVPAATGRHVGGAISGAAGDAGFRNRYPRGGA